MGGFPPLVEIAAYGLGKGVFETTAASLVPNDILIYGYIYDVKSGKLVEVREAMAAGRAS